MMNKAPSWDKKARALLPPGEGTMAEGSCGQPRGQCEQSPEGSWGAARAVGHGVEEEPTAALWGSFISVLTATLGLRGSRHWGAKENSPGQGVQTLSPH